ncbi:hypothetical protein AKJ51_05240 [candidate division MSBL1 archaeon SCGC-AAA382A20]|uniref:Bacterial sugar transferase domain-containing protein n=1 Tax=candidate division MSBL1 archaeon SCGC-AAA382A20 TaxID=1698280 RepID=A0A133VFL7_9EURY|nr:hypothetical protein AKJ51_05240 [candidate division MSBL1 archaeon SCGC-AAA382A20]
MTLCLCWAFAYVVRFHIFPFFTHEPNMNPGQISWTTMKDFAQIFPIVVVVFLAAYALLGLYTIDDSTPWHKKINPILIGSIIGWGLSISTLYYYRRDPFSRIMLFSFLCIVPLGMIISHITSKKIIKFLYKLGVLECREIAVIGYGKLSRQVIHQLSHDENILYNVKYIVSPNGTIPKKRPSTNSEITALPDINSLRKKLEKHTLDGVVVAISRQKSRELEDVLKNLGKLPVPIFYVPDLTGVLNLNIEAHRLADLPLIQLYGSGIGKIQSFIKRILDLTVSVLLLIIFSFPMAFLALAIKLSSKGPVLYKQKRMSLGGRPFILYKFRSMYQNAEEKYGPVWTQEKDPRCTPLGRIMRKTCLDELPQLFNVLKGDMSLVGPRPERPFFVKQFMESLPTYMVRHNVKPGVTGWAQLYGFRGNSSVSKRLEYDLNYIQNWSLALDLWILIATPFAMLFHRHGY